ncbi:MAG TPA: hypothetical protein VGV60_02860 [Candidatus Polarisedimenticolia bacterium]|nr:hypothetical protein [Candidatus Polarisedimenticolia bacterium]
MPIARGHINLVVASLVILLTAVTCSKGDTSVVSAPKDEPAAQATPAPAEPEAKKDAAAGEDEADTAQAPELLPQNAAGAVQGEPAPTNTVPIVAVANYFTELPGIDIAGLKRGQKEKFLQRVNSEICSCGCKNDTLARCYVNDPRCPLVKPVVQKIYEDIKAGK